MDTDKTKCGICGSTRVDDLGKGRSERATVVCLDCQSKWCGIWRTKDDWDKWINEGYPNSDYVYFLETPGYCFYQVAKFRLEQFKKHNARRWKHFTETDGEAAESLCAKGYHTMYRQWRN